MSKIADLQQALSRGAGKTTAPEPPNATAATAQTAPRPPGRSGQINISAWLDPDFKTSLRLVQARRGASSTLQDLLAEALNDLFTKYNVPTIRKD